MKAALALIVTSLALASCGGPKQVGVDHGWVRLAPVAGHPAAAYFELHGGRTDATLVAVSSPQARQAQMHQSKVENGLSTMAPLPQVDIRAGETVKFEPGGKHVMLFDLAPTTKPGDKVTLHLAFADGRVLDYAAPAIAANAPVPAN